MVWAHWVHVNSILQLLHAVRASKEHSPGSKGPLFQPDCRVSNLYLEAGSHRQASHLPCPWSPQLWSGDHNCCWLRRLSWADGGKTGACKVLSQCILASSSGKQHTSIAHCYQHPMEVTRVPLAHCTLDGQDWLFIFSELPFIRVLIELSKHGSHWALINLFIQNIE